MWLRREHFNANTALAEERAAAAETEAAAKEEAMSKVGEKPQKIKQLRIKNLMRRQQKQML